MLDIAQFRSLIIRPALEAIDLHSEAAEELVLGTALQESNLKYLKQLGNGPAIGLWQMEPSTHADIWTNFLKYRPELAFKLRALLPRDSEIGFAQQMAGNLWYGAAMCRVHYFRRKEPLPKAGDIVAQSLFWKRTYNTNLGKGTAAEYQEKWREYMRP